MQSPGRPREFDPDETLSKIMQLFWEHGYEATGLSDITKATGLGKASLYAAFGNKQSMYLKALAQYDAQVVEAAVHMLRAPDKSPLARIDAFVSAPLAALKEPADTRGCFLCNASADRASLDPQTARMVRSGYDRMRAAIAHALHEADPQMCAETRREQAQLILTVYTGLRVMARSGAPVETLEPARTTLMQTLKSTLSARPTAEPSGSGHGAAP